MTDLRVRRPSFEFGTAARWAPNGEFAQLANANSMVPVYIEPFLIKALQRVRPLLPPDDEELAADVEGFIRQEAQHYKNHAVWNRAMVADGYDGMAAIERDYAADYEGFLAHESLRFLMAYGDSFESLGLGGVYWWLEEVDDLVADADQAVVDLWRWHMVEEYEHRTVCRRVFDALYGDEPGADLYRRCVLDFASQHLNHHTSRMATYLLATDRSRMSSAELERSVADEAEYRSRRGAHLQQWWDVITAPGYHPVDAPVPAGFDQLRERY